MILLRAILFTALSMNLITRAADWPQYRGPNHDAVSTETNWTSEWPKEGPKQLWKINVGTGNSPVSILGGKLYTLGFEGGKDTVVCVKCDSGDIVWKHSYDSAPFASMHEGGPAAAPAIDGELLYVQARGGVLYALDAAKGEEKWSL